MIESTTYKFAKCLKKRFGNDIFEKMDGKDRNYITNSYDGEIEIIDEGGKLHYHCPNCGNDDSHKMNVARRVCGYISTNIPNQGRLDEFVNRYIHLDSREC